MRMRPRKPETDSKTGRGLIPRDGSRKMTAERKSGAAVTGSDRQPTFSAQPYVQIRPLVSSNCPPSLNFPFAPCLVGVLESRKAKTKTISVRCQSP